MASLKGLEIKFELRPCIAGNKKALFHRWIDRATVIDGSPMIGGHPGGQLWEVHGLVEFEDGHMGGYPICDIRFLDNKFEEYAWPDMKDSK